MYIYECEYVCVCMCESECVYVCVCICVRRVAFICVITTQSRFSVSLL